VETLLEALGYTVVSEQDNRLLHNTPLYNVYAVRRDDEHPARGERSKGDTPARPGWSGQGALIADVQATLRDALPEYMLPAVHVLVDELPLTQNGKLDHRALPDPESRQPHSQSLVAPRTESERTVARVWAELLHTDVAALGVDSDFFSLGGNSLLVTRLVNRLKQQLGVELAIQTVFELPTLAEMAAELDRCTPVRAVADSIDLDEIREGLGLIESMSDEELDALESND
jgi:acyl carrier protein